MGENPVRAAHALGQSIWLDNISRASLDQGELAGLIHEIGIRGVTSNPSIFQKAIGNSDDYDAEIRTMLDRDAFEIYDQLSIADIRRGLDLFLPIYEGSNCTGWLCEFGGFSRIGTRHGRNHRGSEAVVSDLRSTQCDDQDTGHESRYTSD